MTIQEKMERLEQARAKTEELTRTKERLNGTLEAKKARVKELEDKARKDFDCEIDEIPDLVEKLDAEATAALEKAEKLLESHSAPEDDDDEDSIL
jgi:hypothetical protein